MAGSLAPGALGVSHVGERFDVVVEPVAHGGHCVARVHATDGPGRVVFVRHALPGERVVVEITEGTDGDRFWRGDTVEVPEPSPDRVDPPCPYAGPDRCGGCDFQHVTLARQRSLKADVVREQLSRLAGLDVDVTVEAVPGDHDGLRWRTRQRFVDLPGGRRGMRKHRSHEVVEVDDCLIAGTAGRPRCARRSSSSGRTTASGRCTPAPRRCSSTPCWTSWPRSRGSRSSTCTPASGCSRGSWPTPWVARHG